MKPEHFISFPKERGDPLITSFHSPNPARRAAERWRATGDRVLVVDCKAPSPRECYCAIDDFQIEIREVLEE